MALLLFIISIMHYFLQMIRKDHKETIPCKIALYRKFLECGVTTWEKVIQALEHSSNGDIAKQVKSHLLKDLGHLTK